ncbi:MAG: hypothetical protein LBT40_09985, partial [Deltaproteobacteria bacterium]|nr:hypothetical protein [Deltaproteobacteria bacterium]
MSERDTGRGAPPAVEDWSGPAFDKGEKGPFDGKPRAPEFDEYRQGDRRPLSELASETPSLNYLFSPFDPGRLEEGTYESMLPDTQAREFPFEDLDARDSAIINTLDRAERKAREIVKEADGRAKGILEDVRAEAGGLGEELKARAESDAREIVEEASARAAELVREAGAKEAELAEMKARLDQYKEETRAVSEQVENGRAANLAREKELEAARALLEKDRADWVASRDRDLDELRRRASEEGHAEGVARGEAEGAARAYAETDARLKPLPAILERLQSIYLDLWRENAPQMVELAVDAAEAVLNVRLEDGSGLAAGAFEAAVGYLQHSSSATFKVRPEDLVELEDALRRLRTRMPGLISISFQPDPSLGPGDLVMESDGGRLDATVANRRENIFSALREALRTGAGTLPEPPPLTEEELDPPPEPDSGPGPESGSEAAAGPGPESGSEVTAGLEPAAVPEATAGSKLAADSADGGSNGIRPEPAAGTAPEVGSPAGAPPLSEIPSSSPEASGSGFESAGAAPAVGPGTEPAVAPAG